MAKADDVRQRRLMQAPTAVLADIEAALRGDRHSGGTVELDPETTGPGPLELISKRFIAAAASGDVATVVELLDGGLVSPDVADSTGLTAVLAAAVRILIQCSTNERTTDRQQLDMT